MSAASTWLATCRPRTLPASAVPVIVGSACAAQAGAFRPLPALAALAGALLIQLGTNLANDVFDAEKGADTEERIGPVRAVASGLLTASAVRRAMVAAFGLAALVGVYLVTVGGWPVVAIGVASILSGLAYTGGPWPLGYHGLGDVFVLIFFGFVAVCGTAFVQAGLVPRSAWIASLPVGLLSTAILVVNNLRDRHTDVKAGKRTLAVRFGRTAMLWEYALLHAGSYAAVGWLAWALSSPWPLLGLLALPLSVRLLRRTIAAEGPALNPLLGATAQALLVHGALLSAGLVIARR